MKVFIKNESGKSSKIPIPFNLAKIILKKKIKDELQANRDSEGIGAKLDFDEIFQYFDYLKPYSGLKLLQANFPDGSILKVEI